MRHAICLIVLFGSWCSLSASGGGAVATVDPLATDAAIAAMRKGGNAIDGAVAAGLTLGVVNGYNSGIGGGCFMVIRLASGKIVVIDGARQMVETAAIRSLHDVVLFKGPIELHLAAHEINELCAPDGQLIARSDQVLALVN